MKTKNKQKKTGKKKYRVKNWSAYNNALKQRGSLTVWLDKTVLEMWYAAPTGKQGRHPTYTDTAITLTLQFGAVFGQRLRQTEGLVRSLFSLMDIDLVAPTYTTLSRRGGKVSVKLPKTAREKVTLVADSTGLKVYGEGEWKVRRHGISKRRTWRKVHIAITPDGELRAVKTAPNDTGDNEIVPALLEEETASIDAFSGDGAYDTRGVYDACAKRNIPRLLIPPQKNAKIWQHGNSKDPPHPRDENLRAIRSTSRNGWKASSGYHVRSLSETAMFRFKTIFGDRLHARDFRRQVTEVMIRAAALNRMTFLGMPESYCVAETI